MKAMSRSPIIIREIQKLGEELKSQERSIKGVIVFNDDELTDERIQERLEEVIGIVDESNKLYKKSIQWRQKLAAVSKNQEAAQFPSLPLCAGQGADPNLPQDPFHRVHPLGTQALG